jgi:hypothetical protein
MAGVKRFRRKPMKADADTGLIVAQYVPGRALDDLRAVAAHAFQGEVAECLLPSGPVLVARYTDVPDDHPAQSAYAEVAPGEWLYYSETYELLGNDTTQGIAQFYDEVPDD